MPTQPIRLEALFGSAQTLVEEYTRTIAKGRSVLTARKPVATNTRFLVAMGLPGQRDALELEGRIVDVVATSAGFEIGVAYERAIDQREMLEKLVAQIAVDPSYEVLRSHPRIPVCLVAHTLGRARVSIRDLSRAGMQLELGTALEPGTHVELAVTLALRTCTLVGTVVWSRGIRAGVRFDALDALQTMVVDGMLRLLRPERLEIRFGTHGHMIAEAARTHLACLGPLQAVRELSPLDMMEDRHSVRVAIHGDMEIELLLEANAAVGGCLASYMIAEEADTDDIIVDALAETLTAIAGTACDRLEAADRVLEVSEPLIGHIAPRPGDIVEHLALRSSRGVVQLTMVLRDPARAS